MAFLDREEHTFAQRRCDGYGTQCALVEVAAVEAKGGIRAYDPSCFGHVSARFGFGRRIEMKKRLPDERLDARHKEHVISFARRKQGEPEGVSLGDALVV
jgi:hypothetical protein